jgi:hypothetical protein
MKSDSSDVIGVAVGVAIRATASPYRFFGV